MSKRTVKSPLLGALSMAVAAAIVALATVVAPSFAGSYLTRQQAAKTFVKKADVQPGPVARIVPNTADVGPLNTTSSYDIPGARAVFKTTTETSDVVITFSAEATCTAAKSGVGCPIQVVVDGYANPKVNLLTSSSASPAPKESIQTYVTSAIVTPGQHVVSVRYTGSSDTSVQFKVSDFNLVTQAYPTGDVVKVEE